MASKKKKTEDEDEVEEVDPRPVLYDVKIRPPTGVGSGRGSLPYWWSRFNEYRKRKWVTDKRARDRAEKESSMQSASSS